MGNHCTVLLLGAVLCLDSDANGLMKKENIHIDVDTVLIIFAVCSLCTVLYYYWVQF